MAKVVWSHRATSQLENSLRFIKEEQGISYSKVVCDRIFNSVRLLSTSPNMGQIEPLLKHKKSEYRYLIVGSYKIIYKVEKSRVVVSRVFHTSRDPNKLRGI